MRLQSKMLATLLNAATVVGPVAAQVTGEDGCFTWTDLVPGHTYAVEEDDPLAWFTVGGEPLRRRDRTKEKTRSRLRPAGESEAGGRPIRSD